MENTASRGIGCVSEHLEKIFQKKFLFCKTRLLEFVSDKYKAITDTAFGRVFRMKKGNAAYRGIGCLSEDGRKKEG